MGVGAHTTWILNKPNKVAFFIMHGREYELVSGGICAFSMPTARRNTNTSQRHQSITAPSISLMSPLFIYKQKLK